MQERKVIRMAYSDFYIFNVARNSGTVHQNDTMAKEMEPGKTPYTILFLFVSFILGALIRHLLKHCNLPYTVVLFVLGACFGFLCIVYPELNNYTLITRLDPNTFMQMFLPVLIFESAFCMDAHMFIKSIGQSLLLAVPGLIICTVLTAVFAKNVLALYNWNWITCFTFGTILSATDPVAVVALLKEVGISPALTTLIEGESLLNDGSAIVIFEVLLEIMTETHTTLSAGTIILMFIKISLGAPIFGYFVGKLATACLNRVYNDSIIEITITFALAYLTYYLSTVFGISGVLAVVVLGVVISAEKSSFSPEIEESVIHFWEMLSYLANTLIFIIVGVIIAERAVKQMTSQDSFLIIATYMAATFFRMLMIGILSPVLKRFGYGLTWKHAVVLTWGGLRGAVGLALALMLTDNPAVDNAKIADKILLHLSGIVVLTLVINGTTMQFLLKILDMKVISYSRRAAMAHAVQLLRDTAMKSARVQHMNKFHCDANWMWVAAHTYLKDPYNKSEDIDPFLWSTFVPLRATKCPECELEHTIEPTDVEMKEMSEEARLRVIKALKVCYWRQFEMGFITRKSVRTLVSAADEATDIEGEYINVIELKKHMKIHPFFIAVKRFLRKLAEKLHVDTQDKTEEWLKDLLNETRGFRNLCLKIYINPLFEPTICLVLMLNAVYIIVDYFIQKNKTVVITLIVINFLFVAFYTLEAIIKIISLQCSGYFKIHWNKFDFFVFIIAISELILDFTVFFFNWTNYLYINVLRMVIILRLVHMCRLFKIFLARLVSYSNDYISKQLYSVYDLAHGFVAAEEEVMKKMDYVVDYPPIANIAKKISDTSTLAILKVMADIQLKHPGIAIALKSHQAARHILNDVKTSLEELKHEGLLDDNEYEKLYQEVENKIKDSIGSPFHLPPNIKTKHLLTKVEWITDQRLLNIVIINIIVKDYNVGQTIHEKGKMPQGLEIITSGIVKITGKQEIVTSDSLPNTDSFQYFTRKGKFHDYISVCQTLGMLGFLVGTPFVTSAVCETEVEVIHIGYSVLKTAQLHMHESPPLQYILWRVVALKIAVPLLMEQTHFQGWSVDKIKLRLENCIIPDLLSATNFVVDSLVEDIILIQGHVRDTASGQMYTGPAYIPNTTRSLTFMDDTEQRARPVMVLIAADDYMVPQEFDWSGIDSKLDRDRLCLLHTIKRRQTIVSQMLSIHPSENSNADRRHDHRDDDTRPLQLDSEFDSSFI